MFWLYSTTTSNKSHIHSFNHCPSAFHRKGDLKVNEQNHIGKQHFKCGTCEKSLSSASSLKNHQKLHLENRKKLKCQVCSSTFHSRSNLKTHEQIHTGEKPFKCEICGKDFSQSSNLKVHQKIHLKGEKAHECNECSSTFHRREHLKSHQRTHTDKKPF